MIFSILSFKLNTSGFIFPLSVPDIFCWTTFVLSGFILHILEGIVFILGNWPDFELCTVSLTWVFQSTLFLVTIPLLDLLHQEKGVYPAWFCQASRILTWTRNSMLSSQFYFSEVEYLKRKFWETAVVIWLKTRVQGIERDTISLERQLKAGQGKPWKPRVWSFILYTQ